MSSHCQYFCAGSDMSVGLRAMERDARRAKPDHFTPQKQVVQEHIKLDGGGTEVVMRTVKDTRATVLDGKARHALSLQKKRY